MELERNIQKYQKKEQDDLMILEDHNCQIFYKTE